MQCQTTGEKLERYLEELAAEQLLGREQIYNFVMHGGYCPQKKQRQFHAAARACDASDGPTEIGLGGARGGGKTHAILMQIAADDCQRMPNLKCLLLRKVGKAVRESFEDLRQRLGRMPHKYNRGEGHITFENGSRIILGHFKNESDIDAYLGLEYDVIGLEEATTLTLRKYRAIRTCNRTSKPDWRPRIYNNTNPGGVGHAYYKKRFIEPMRRQDETETRFIPATVDDNVFVNREYKKTLDDLTGWLKRAWRFGDWDIAAGQFFTTWRSDVHVVKPFVIPSHWRVWCAMDYGFVHWTVVYLLAEDDVGNVYVVDEHAKRGWLVPRHVSAINAMLKRRITVPRRVKVFVTGADVFAKRGNAKTSVGQQYTEAGFKMKAANMDRINGAAQVLRFLGDIEGGITPKLFVFDRCVRLIECIPSLEHDPYNPEDVLKIDTDEDGNGGDDPYDTLRYGLMELDRMRGRRVMVGQY